MVTGPTLRPSKSSRRPSDQRGSDRQIKEPRAAPQDSLLDLDEALTRLEAIDPLAASLGKLRYFSGLTMAQTAKNVV
jgi:hypothetical protein